MTGPDNGSSKSSVVITGLILLTGGSSTLLLFRQVVFPELFKHTACIFNETVIPVSLEGFNV
jgi:hypothetical protein